MTGLYVKGDSPVHKLSAGAKIIALLLFGTVLFIFESWPLLMLGAVLIAFAFWLAHFNWKQARDALRPLMWIFLILFAVHAVFGSWLTGLFVVLRFAVLILAAALVTMTTRTSEFVEAIEKAFRHGPKWIPAEKIALAIALALRFIPRIGQLFEEIRQAQRARGLERSMTALAVPLIVRTLRDADEIARAIEARSVN